MSFSLFLSVCCIGEERPPDSSSSPSFISMCGCKISFWGFFISTEVSYVTEFYGFVAGLKQRNNKWRNNLYLFYSSKESTAGRNYLEKRNIQQLQKNHFGLKLCWTEETAPEGHVKERNSCRKFAVPFLLPAGLAFKNNTSHSLQKKKLRIYFCL